MRGKAGGPAPTWNGIAAFAVSAADGSLSGVGYFDGGGAVNFPRSIAIDAAGALVVAGNQAGNSFTVFTVDAATGALALAGTTNLSFPAFFVGFVPQAAANSELPVFA